MSTKTTLLSNIAIPPNPTFTPLGENKDLECAICQDHCFDPVLLPCDHMFCRQCLLSLGNKPCPTCRTPWEVDKLKEPYRIICNLFDNIVVSCDACKKVVRRGLKGEHFTKHALESCSIKCAQGCQWIGTRATLMVHVRTTCDRCPCPRAPCEWLGKYQALGGHLEKDCQFADILCPEGCGESLPRGQMGSHLANACSAIKKREQEENRKREEQLAKELEAVCDSLNPAWSELITLNVGGTTSITSRATLTKYPMSVLGVLFSERHRKLQRDNNGVVHLDRPAQSFSYILAWLQSGVIPRDLGSYDADLLLQEAKIWKLEALLAELEGESEVPDKRQAAHRLSQDELWKCMKISGCASGGRLSLPGVDLSGLYLGGARLNKAVLTGSNLQGTNFGCASLAGSNLSNADLQHSNLHHANLSDADLSCANLSDADLTGTVLKGANLSWVDLSGRVLTGTNFTGTCLSGADLTNANLTDANFSNAQMVGCKTKGANFEGATWNNTTVTFYQTDFSGPSRWDSDGCYFVEGDWWEG